VERIAGRVGDTFGDKPVSRGRQIGTTDPDMGGAAKGRGKITQPIPVGIRVVVDVGDDLALARSQTGVARGRSPLLG
jgi:hypothetical protein